MAVLRKRSKWPRKRISKQYENAWSKVYKNAWKKSTKTQWQTDLLLKTIAKDYHRDITFSFLWQNSSDNFGWTFTCSTGRRAVGKICTASFCTVSTCACDYLYDCQCLQMCCVCVGLLCIASIRYLAGLYGNFEIYYFHVQYKTSFSFITLLLYYHCQSAVTLV